jgi:hypothetical protein
MLTFGSLNLSRGFKPKKFISSTQGNTRFLVTLQNCMITSWVSRKNGNMYSVKPGTLSDNQKLDNNLLASSAMCPVLTLTSKAANLFTTD